MKKGKKHDFCDGLISVSTFIFLGTWFLAIISFIVRGEYPETLVQHVTLMQGICYASYCCKAAYEKKADKKGGECE